MSAPNWEVPGSNNAHVSECSTQLDYNRLQLDAACVLSDSGTIAEESTMLGFPAVTLRSSIERPEALDTGAITMTDLDSAVLPAAIRFAMGRESRGGQRPADYQVTNTSERVVNFILSTAFQHRAGAGCGSRRLTVCDPDRWDRASRKGRPERWLSREGGRDRLEVQPAPRKQLPRRKGGKAKPSAAQPKSLLAEGHQVLCLYCRPSPPPYDARHPACVGP